MLNTFLVFAVIPLGIAAVIAALVMVGSEKTARQGRYRPGRPYSFEPVWFLAAAEVGGAAPGETRQLQRGGSRPELESAFIEDSAGQRVLPGPTGGASDRW